MKLKPRVDDLRERFILFLASKPADEYYYWNDTRRCACGTFIKEQLKLKPKAADPEPIMVWARWDQMARTCATYGALLELVRESD